MATQDFGFKLEGNDLSMCTTLPECLPNCKPDDLNQDLECKICKKLIMNKNEDIDELFKRIKLKKEYLKSYIMKKLFP